MKGKEILVLFAVFLLAFFLRVYHLGILPFGFYEEEVTNAYVGRFILQNGVDLYGNRFPLLYFDKFGDYPPVLPMYLSGLSTFIFGFTEFAARFPIALIGSLMVFPVYGLAFLIFRKRWLGVLAGLFTALLPWHVVLSRTSAEGVVALAVYTWALVLVFDGIAVRNRKKILWAFGLFFITYFLYPGFRLLVPLTLLPLPLFVSKQHTSLKKLLVVGLIASFVVTAGIAAMPWGRGRFVQTSLFGSDEAKAQVALRNTILANGDNTRQLAITRLFHNKVVGYTRYFLEQYLSYFSPMHLFLDASGQRRYYNVPDQGLLLLTLAPLLLFGLLPLVQKKTDVRLVRFSVYLLLITPLPAALTIDFPPHAHRSIAMILPFVLLATYGASNFFSLFKKKTLLVGVLLVFLFLESVYFWHQYSWHEAVERSILRNGGDRELAQYLITRRSQYDRIFAPAVARLPIYYLYFSKNVDRSLAGKFRRELYIDTVGMLTFLPTECVSREVPADKLSGRVLVVDYAGCPSPPNRFRSIDGIVRRDSTAAYTMLVPLQ